MRRPVCCLIKFAERWVRWYFSPFMLYEMLLKLLRWKFRLGPFLGDLINENKAAPPCGLHIYVSIRISVPLVLLVGRSERAPALLSPPPWQIALRLERKCAAPNLTGRVIELSERPIDYAPRAWECVRLCGWGASTVAMCVHMSWLLCARDLLSNQIARADYRQFAHQPQPTVLHTQWLILVCPVLTVVNYKRLTIFKSYCALNTTRITSFLNKLLINYLPKLWQN